MNLIHCQYIISLLSNSTCNYKSHHAKYSIVFVQMYTHLMDCCNVCLLIIDKLSLLWWRFDEMSLLFMNSTVTSIEMCLSCLQNNANHSLIMKYHASMWKWFFFLANIQVFNKTFFLFLPCPLKIQWFNFYLQNLCSEIF